MRQSKYVADVAEFHEKMGVPMLSVPTMPNWDRITLRRSIIEEESEELDCALEQEDIVAVADGMADLIYVVIGTALELGVDLDAVWDEVHRTNMAKEGGPTRADGKILKPEGWQPPDIARVLREQGGTTEIIE